MKQLRLPSQYMPTSYVSPHEFFSLLEKTMGERLPEADQRLFEDCYCAQDFVTVIAESKVLEHLEVSLWKLAQIYVALLGGFKLAKTGQRGYDALDAFDLIDPKAGTIQVKWGGPGESGAWHKGIVSKDGQIHYNVFVLVVGANTRNPAKSSILVIPAEDLQSLVEAETPYIDVSKNKYHLQSGKLNAWWEYHLPDHDKLRERVQAYVYGLPITTYADLPLFSEMPEDELIIRY